MAKKISVLILLAFSARIAAIFILGWHINPETWEYDTLALNILSGKGYVYNHFNTDCYLFGPSPLYAYFEALIHFITGKNYFILEIVQAVIAALAVIPIFYIARKVFNEKTAFISGLLYCLHPGLVVYTGKIHEFTLVAFFILTIIYLLVCFEDEIWNVILAGVLIGVGILLRPTLIYTIPSFFIYLMLKKKGFKKAVSEALILFLLAVAVISPWIYRGYKIYNRIIFVTSSSSWLFWRGNNPNASGTALTADKKPIFSVADESFKKKIYSMDEMGQYDFFKADALKYILENPGKFLENTAKKFMYFWSFSPQTGLTYPAGWFSIYKLIYCFLALFFVVGLCFAVGGGGGVDKPALVFLFSIFIIISLGQSLFYTEMRHRWMLEPLLMIISAYGISRVFSARRDIFPG